MLLAMLLWTTTAVAALPDGVSVGAPPQWVQEHAFRAADDDFYRLVDTQFWIDDADYRMYRRVVAHAEDRDAVSFLGTQRLTYRSAWQTLELHHVRVHRDGQVIDVLDKADIGSARPGYDPQTALYDDRTEAVVLVHDLRVGDLLDYAWSVSGSPPNEQDHHELWLSTPSGYAADREEISVITPRGTQAVVLGGAVEGDPYPLGPRLRTTWSLDETDTVDVPADAPSGWGDPRSVAFTSLDDWADVSAWARPLYDKRLEPDDELALQIRKWSALEPENRARAAVDFVQDEVRYLAIAFGPHALEPHEPDRVLQRRFGDCKDKSLLLVSLLRELNVRAEPALVSSYKGRQLPDVPPMIGAFDHVIVRIHLEDGPVWVDPTRSLEGGPLADRSPPPFHYALPITEEGLVALPGVDVGNTRVHVEETIKANLEYRRGVLSVDTVHHGREARSVRSEVESRGEAAMAERYVEFYGSGGWKVEPRLPAEFSDDRDANVYRVTEDYTVTEFMDDEGTLSTHAWLISNWLPQAPEADRVAPVALHGPAKVRYTLKVDFDEGYEPAYMEPCVPIDTDFLTFDCTLAQSSGDGFVGVWDLELLTDRVEPAQFEQLRFALESIDGDLSWDFGDADVMRARSPAAERLAVLAPLIAMLGAAVITLLLLGLGAAVWLWQSGAFRSVTKR